jgi:hypothetical protein
VALTKEQRKVRALFKQLVKAPAVEFPAPRGRLKAPTKQGVYVIYSPRGKVMHVGGTPRGKDGVRQRLKDHLHNASSFTRDCLNLNGARLRRGYSFRCIAVANARLRAFLEAYAIGNLCPRHIGLGALREVRRARSRL